ncbi:hypothetical protein GCM10028806_42420 [Spirosoma terrae]|uniref:DUF4890 domain-containing protein n=1 Tax=Spirosoma terrae TaxID=1968276 RepID=A0A6L9L3Q2_9BACT|nr:hypothetical protein [Spirosoma terrae]NDU94092.1 hypothetical protein [Spirosoma terrae]
MNVNAMMTAVAALFLSVATYAQSQPPVHKEKPKLTPEQREARKADMKAKLAQMTPDERKAFKKAHHERMQARLNAMTPEERAKFLEHRRQRKAQRDHKS